jgi:hypothetical protein
MVIFQSFVKLPRCAISKLLSSLWDCRCLAVDRSLGGFHDSWVLGAVTLSEEMTDFKAKQKCVIQ